VGVVRGERQIAHERPRMEAYYPMTQSANPYMHVLVRGAGDPRV
jgi:hypothetical protein